MSQLLQPLPIFEKKNIQKFEKIYSTGSFRGGKTPREYFLRKKILEEFYFSVEKSNGQNIQNLNKHGCELLVPINQRSKILNPKSLRNL